MTFFQFVFNAFVCFVGSDFFALWFGPLFGLFFIGLVPCLIRELIVWR